MTHHGKIIAGGKVVIPADIRRAFGMTDGDRIVFDVEDGKVILRTYDQVIKDVQARVRRYVPEGISLVDDLIAERRAEAEREER